MTVKLVGSSSGSVALAAPASTTSSANIEFKLPVADGSANQLLKTDGSGQLSFASILAASSSDLTINSGSSDNPLLLNSTNANGAHLRFQSSGTTKHYIGCAAGFGFGDHEDLALRTTDNLIFATGSTERMRINTTAMQVARDSYIGTVASGQSVVNIGTSGGAQIGFHKSGDNNDELKFYTHTSGSSHAERMSIDPSGDLRVGRVYSNTTSGGANVRVQSDGLMQRDTSSRRYKNSIEDATHGLADLNKLRPVTYKGNNDGDTVFGGLIAEEVHDAGLTEFVDYDSDNQPDALKYGNMVSLCIKAIQELSAKVETLETKVAALEAK